MRFFGKGKSLTNKALRSMASTIVTQEGLDQLVRGDSPAPVMESGDFEFLIFLVEADSSAATQAAFCRAMDGALAFNGRLICVMCSICLLVFKAKPDAPADDVRDRNATVTFLRSAFGDAIRIVQGTAAGSIGFFHLKQTGHYGVALNAFPQILRLLAACPAGGVEDFADTPVR